MLVGNGEKPLVIGLLALAILLRNDLLAEFLKPHKFPLCDGTDDYTEICGNSREAMMLEVAPDRLVVRSCDFVHPEAGDLDRVEILPDRTARAL